MRLVSKLKTFCLTLFALSLITLLMACQNKPSDPTIPTEVVPMQLIKEIKHVTETPTQFEKVEFELVELEPKIALEGNPYDSRYLRIQGIFKSPSSDIKVIPAFWFQDYTISLNTSWTSPPSGLAGVPSTNPNEPQGLEMVEFKGDPHFRLRYLPLEVGLHTFHIEIYKDDAIVQILQSQFMVEQGVKDYKGRIMVEPNHQRNFMFSNGDTFIPIGQNTAWYTSTTRQTEDFRVWFENMHENYANFTRIWMAPWNFALHWGDQYDDFSSKQNAAARLDKVFDLAETYDIYFMLALLNHGQFSAHVNPQWNLNPWNKANGGILDYPSQFFTLHEAKETYKQQLLYMIGRYGYSTHLMAWELFNEVDWTDQFHSTANYIWHTEMAQFIKSNDSYQKLITTSYKGHTGGAYQSGLIDFVNPHSYDYTSKNMMVHLTPVLNNLFNQYNKPVLQSEIGINWQNGQSTTTADPTGISLKQAQWAGMMGGGAGGAMNWWWDSWTHPNNLYYRFIGAGKFSRLMDMVGQTYQLLHQLPGVSISNQNVGILGYQIDQRIYGYLYDRNYRHNFTSISSKTLQVTLPISTGTYILEIYNTDTGDKIEQRSVTSIQNQMTFQISFVEDVAFILLEDHS